MKEEQALMTNTEEGQSIRREALFVGYRLRKVSFGFNEYDPHCIDFKR